jgi:hypothetical protein
MADEPSDIPEDVTEPVQPEPEPAPKPPPSMEGNGKSETISDSVRRARDVIPVGDRGVTPQTYAQWIDIAKDVCKAYLMLPQHLHNNPPVMAGLLEIAARFQLSAYMLASQTYVQNNRLCFQAQAFGAILYASGLLRGRLKFEFYGEGEDMTCSVSGRFKDDPDAIYSATTPPVKLIHPGHTQKEGKTFVKGSPLWDRDPEQQLSYFAERRWIRRYAPDACMGMYTREEIDEIDEFRAGQKGAIPLTADRLGQLDTDEGWREGAHVDMDLAAIAPEQPESQPEPEPEPPSPPRKPPRRPARKTTGGRKPVAKAKATPAPKASPGRPAKPRRGRPPSRAVIKEVVKRAELPPRRVTAMPPKWLDYISEADAWIATVTNEEKAELKWDAEREARDKLQVPIGERSRLRAMLDRKIAQLRPKPKTEDEA